MIQPSKLTRGKIVQAYKVVYSVNWWQQNNWSNHLLNETQRSVPVKFPWECDPNYMDWFLKITHRYVQVLKLRTRPRRVRGAQDIANAKLVRSLIPPLFRPPFRGLCNILTRDSN